MYRPTVTPKESERTLSLRQIEERRNQVEDFVSDLMPLTESLQPDEAKIAYEMLRKSLSGNKDAVKVHCLNIRYALSKKGKVSLEMETFLNFLENSAFISWDEVIQALYLSAQNA